MNDSLRYPIGKFTPTEGYTSEEINSNIRIIEDFPKLLKSEVAKLGQSKLDTPYRPEGWTIRQVIHHCADSHMNSFIRFKLALTENNPTIKPYHENLWAHGTDYLEMDINPSLLILEGLHTRWTNLLKSFSTEEFQLTFHHPESKKNMNLELALALYAWHCQHHLGHVKIVSEANPQSV